ncbi:MAG: hypothetical protein MH321_18620 [Leptospiraceae bacterium]|nr:hypothetical protein [Leptospiraceae bacterium]
MRALQIITDEYLETCFNLTAQERLDWLEQYNLLIPISAYKDRENSN